jgi:hypothetical protein
MAPKLALPQCAVGVLDPSTWLKLAGIDKWEAAGFLGMSVEMLNRVSGHHHPDYLRAAARAIGFRPRQTLAITLAVSDKAASHGPQPFEIASGPGRTRTCNQTVMSETRKLKSKGKTDD